MRILAVGTATRDVVNSVPQYPHEDQEVRATEQQISRGGNAANTLVVLSQLQHRCSWAGMLAEDADSRFILDDLNRNGVDSGHCTRYAGGKTPTSYITLSQENGSRTIVHYRDLPEYPAAAFAEIDLTPFDWLHFEGRNVPELRTMLQHVRSQGGPTCSVEVEKPREGIETLFSLADVLLFSRYFALHQGFTEPEGFLQIVGRDSKLAYCAWGDAGAWLRDRQGLISHAEAEIPPKVVNTLAAGDVFNAAVIHELVRGGTASQALRSGCRLAGYKCGLSGLDGLAGAL